MSKVRFELKKLKMPVSIREAGKVLQAIDTIIHPSLAESVVIELFSRGREMGFCMLVTDLIEQRQTRIGFAERYKSDEIVVYWAPGGKMGDFMRGITAYLNREETEVQAAYFPAGTFLKTAEFIVEIFEK